MNEELYLNQNLHREGLTSEENSDPGRTVGLLPCNESVILI